MTTTHPDQNGHVGSEGVPDPDLSQLEGETREEQARHLVNKFMLGSLAAGLMPSFIDVAAVTAMQLKMLHSMGKLYNLPFSENAVQSIIASLIGGIGARNIARGTFGSIVKLIPFVGPVAGAATMPMLSAASTYAIGTLFVQHFESGGTFLDFQPTKLKQYYRELFKDGQSIASDLQQEIKKRKQKSEEKTADKKTPNETAPDNQQA